MAQQQNFITPGVAGRGKRSTREIHRRLCSTDARGSRLSGAFKASRQHKAARHENSVHLRLWMTGSGAALMAHLLDEDLPQPALPTRVVLEVEAVKAVEDVFVRVHVQGVHIQVVPAACTPAGWCVLLAATTFQALTMLPLVGGSRYQQHQSMHCSALTSTPKTGQIAAAAEQQAQAAVRQGARGGISGMGWAIEAASYGLHQMSCKPSAAERGGTMWCDAELAAGCCCHVSFVT